MEIEHFEYIAIPMSDGTKLAARVFMPKDASINPYPAVLEYIPYRRRDNTRARDDVMHPYIASKGYICVRVDIRGSGDSEGVLKDEYLQSELDDGVEIIEWLCKQNWCNGNVGIIGISWGGFNALQIASMRPKALKAVISVASTDDRYSDDVHHMGGCLLGDNLSWASTMFAFNSLPPDPQIVGDRWRDMWKQRLEGSGLWLQKWLEHQRRDEYWKHGSVCEDFSSIECPVMAVSGWADGYTNSVFRLLEKLSVPRLGLVGPWSHKYPHQGIPGPAINFLDEALRWWDRWLKGINNNIMEEPMLRAWMQYPMPPSTFYNERPGRWVGEDSWPSPDTKYREYALSPRGELIEEGVVESEVMHIKSPLSVGMFAGKWCSYGATPDLPHDQREEDGGALVFETYPLDKSVDILGAPEAELDIECDEPIAMTALRLSSVAPDGKATRVTYGVLNFTHKDSSEHPKPLIPHKRYRVKIRLNDIGQRILEGYRIRLSISTSYWPLVWPSPKPFTLKIRTDNSVFRLPLREEKEEDRHISFSSPKENPNTTLKNIEPGNHKWRLIRDLASDISTLEVINDSGLNYIEATDTRMKSKALEWYSFQGDEYSSVKGETLWERSFKRNKWDVKTVTRTLLTSDSQRFYILAELDAYEGEKRVYSDNWDVEIPRNLI